MSAEAAKPPVAEAVDPVATWEQAFERSKQPSAGLVQTGTRAENGHEPTKPPAAVLQHAASADPESKEGREGEQAEEHSTADDSDKQHSDTPPQPIVEEDGESRAGDADNQQSKYRCCCFADFDIDEVDNDCLHVCCCFLMCSTGCFLACVTAPCSWVKERYCIKPEQVRRTQIIGGADSTGRQKKLRSMAAAVV